MENCKYVGFARLDMTPQLGVQIPGYPQARYGDGVLDPLYINTVAFRQGNKTAVLIVCDTLGNYGPLAYELPKAAAEKFDIDEKAVFICHTHTHTGPFLSHWIQKADETYLNWFTIRLMDSIQIAISDLTPVTRILAGEDDIPDIAFVRRYKMKDGTYQTWGRNGDSNIECPEVEPDDSMRIIRIEREKSDEIVLANFQCHPDCIGGTKYSADYPGEFRKCFEDKRRNTKCVFLDGAEGNLTRNDYMHGFKPKSYEASMELGIKLADGAVKIYDKATELYDDSLLAYGREVARAKTKRNDALVPEMMRIRKLYSEERFDEIAPLKSDAIALAVEASQIIALKEMKKDFIDLNVTALGFGPIAFLGLPGEPFCETGIAIRKASPYKVTCVCCHTNGSEGYYPTDDAYDHGGYEPRASRLAKGAEPLLRKTAEQLLNDIHK